jgi:hypothetical protein
MATKWFCLHVLAKWMENFSAATDDGASFCADYDRALFLFHHHHDHDHHHRHGHHHRHHQHRQHHRRVVVVINSIVSLGTKRVCSV